MATMTTEQARQILDESPAGIVVRITERGVTVTIDRDTEIDDEDLGQIVTAAMIDSESHDDRGRANLVRFAGACAEGEGPVPTDWTTDMRGDRRGEIDYSDVEIDDGEDE